MDTSRNMPCDLTPTPLLKERDFNVGGFPLSFRRGGQRVRSQAEGF
jgi:hypothetical protein